MGHKQKQHLQKTWAQTIIILGKILENCRQIIIFHVIIIKLFKKNSKIIFIGTSFSVNITSMALRKAITMGIDVEIVDPEPIKINYENVTYHYMTAEEYCDMRKLNN